MHNHKKKSRIKFLLFILVLVSFGYLGRYLNIDTKTIQNSLSGFPLAYSAILYVIFYVILTFFIFFSKDVFWLVGAVLFGAYLSTLLIWVAEIINAFILFNLARHLGRSFVDHHLDEKYRHLDEKLGRLSFFWLFIFRAAPLIPHRFLDLGAGLTKIKFRRYLMAVIFGTPFKIFWIQYILAGVGASVFNNPSALVGYFLSNKILFIISLIYPLLVIAVAFKLIARK